MQSSIHIGSQRQKQKHSQPHISWINQYLKHTSITTEQTKHVHPLQSIQTTANIHGLSVSFYLVDSHPRLKLDTTTTSKDFFNI